jgi:Transposase DDE domain
MLFIGVADFNVLETTGFFRGWFNAYWKAGVCPTDGLLATAHFPALRGQVPRTLSDTHLFAPRPIPVHGLRTTDLSGKLARHRDLPAGAFRQALPSGHTGGIARSTLADANENRDWRIYQDFALGLIQTARKLYAEDSFGLELAHTVYALDSTTIDLCLALFPWARFRKRKGAVKLHTLLDLRGNIPAFIHISDGKLHDVNILDRIAFEAGSFYVMDRGYIDFARLYALHLSQAFFVTRAKANLRYRRIYSRPVDKTTGLRCDQTIRLTGPQASQDYPGPVATGKVLRCQKRQIAGLSYQQLRPSSPDYRRALSLPLAGGVVLQMDQAASADQGVFWRFRKCRQDTSLDRHRRLCTRRHSQKTAEIGSFTLHNSTDFEPDPIRKNAAQSIGCKYRDLYRGNENA